MKAREDKLFNEINEFRKPYMNELNVSYEKLVQVLRNNPLLSSQDLIKLGYIVMIEFISLIDDINTIDDILNLNFEGIKLHSMIKNE